MITAYLRSIAKRFLRRGQTDREMQGELESHVQLRADALERDGLDRPEAERHARIEFGGHYRFKEECHEAMGGNAIDQAIQDVPFSLPALRKSPGFSLVAGDHSCSRHWRDSGNVFGGEYSFATAVCVQPSGKTALDLFATQR